MPDNRPPPSPESAPARRRERRSWGLWVLLALLLVLMLFPEHGSRWSYEALATLTGMPSEDSALDSAGEEQRVLLPEDRGRTLSTSHLPAEADTRQVGESEERYARTLRAVPEAFQAPDLDNPSLPQPEGQEAAAALPDAGAVLAGGAGSPSPAQVTPLARAGSAPSASVTPTLTAGWPAQTGAAPERVTERAGVPMEFAAPRIPLPSSPLGPAPAGMELSSLEQVRPSGPMFLGSWRGRYEGADRGEFFVRVLPGGVVAGQGRSYTLGVVFNIAGRVLDTGEMQLAKAASGSLPGGEFRGRLGADTGDGTWTITALPGAQGRWSAQRGD